VLARRCDFQSRETSPGRKLSAPPAHQCERTANTHSLFVVPSLLYHQSSSSHRYSSDYHCLLCSTVFQTCFCQSVIHTRGDQTCMIGISLSENNSLSVNLTSIHYVFEFRFRFFDRIYFVLLKQTIYKNMGIKHVFIYQYNIDIPSTQQ
jgi:hypothetical protein